MESPKGEMMKNSKFLLSAILFLTFIHLPLASLGAATDVKACLKQAMQKEDPLYQVPEEGGTDGYSRYLVLICNGSVAKDLYNSISDAASPGDWNGRTRGEVKFFGENGSGSMCYHISRNSDGEPTNDYNCSVRLSIASKELGKTQTKEMIPFSVK